MTVYFIGAGPGDPELLTLRGRRLIERCPVCLYAGSLVPPAIVAAAPADALVRDTAPLNLDEILALIEEAHAAGQDVARVHSGDPCLYGAVSEQIHRLRARGIDYEIIPGVPAFAAAAAALGRELTLPGVAQSVILTRTASQSSPMPPGEDLAAFAASGATLVLHLSVRALLRIRRELEPVVGADAPVVVVYRVGWPDQEIIHGRLSDIRDRVRARRITRTALILLGPALTGRHERDSALYDPAAVHLLRPGRKAKRPRGGEPVASGRVGEG